MKLAKSLFNTIGKFIDRGFCVIDLHSWRDGPGYPCTLCGKEDDFWK